MIDPSKLRDDLTKFVGDRLPEGIAGIEVEPAVTEDGSDFLLVTIKLVKADLDDEALGQLLEDIEDEVAKRDERYPSVRFQDAA